MKFSTFSIIGCVCAVLCGAGTTAAQQAGDIYFRLPARSARSLGVADATVADIQSVGGAAWNPASLAYLESVSADVTLLGNMDGRRALADVALPLAIDETFGFAVEGYASAFDRVDWSKQTGMLSGAGISYGVRLTPTFSIGAEYNFQTATFGGASLTSHGVSIGLLYTALPAITYGLTVTGIGSGITYRQTDTLSFIEKENPMPRSVTLGGSWHFPTTHDRIVFNYFLSGSKIIGVNQDVYRMGVELFPWKFLALRGGIVSGPITTSGRAGVGFRTSFVEVDYAFASSVAEERMHVVTVSIPLFKR